MKDDLMKLLKNGVVSLIVKGTYEKEYIHATLNDNLIPATRIDNKANMNPTRIDFYRVDIGTWGSVVPENIVSYRDVLTGASLI